ncbi:MAG TPA: hypothetical protein VIM56_00060 [Rhizomicrobium sp.]
MAETIHKTASQAAEMGPIAPNSSQTAQYIRELIESLRKMATGQKEEMLAILLQAASMEANRIARRDR